MDNKKTNHRETLQFFQTRLDELHQTLHDQIQCDDHQGAHLTSGLILQYEHVCNTLATIHASE